VVESWNAITLALMHEHLYEYVWNTSPGWKALVGELVALEPAT